MNGAATLFLVVNGWVLFRSRDFGTWLAMLRAMYTGVSGRGMPTRDIAFVLIAASVVLAAMIASRIVPSYLERLRQPAWWSGAVYAVGVPAVLIFAPTVAAPFIYFRF
jgi:hypothetical protein